MKNLIYKIFTMILAGTSMILTACNNDEPNGSPYVDPTVPKESTILMYAVASNNLDVNFLQDRNEILQAAKNIDLDKNNVLIFQTFYKYDAEEGVYMRNQRDVSLVKLVKSGDKYSFETIKNYPDDTAPLNPQIVSEVVDYVFNTYPSESKGMIFWSHSTASNPYLTTKSGDADSSAGVWDVPQSYSFGHDGTVSAKQYQEINVDELANALPDKFLDFIWFDSCYMGNVETIYQFRNKCDYYVGYPTEVWEWGLNYDEVLPFLTKKNPDYIEAATTFFNYYYNRTQNSNATIGVTDMSKIEQLADFCRGVFKNTQEIPSPRNFIIYSRSNQYYFYDLGDYLKSISQSQGVGVSNEEWSMLLDDVMVYRAGTEYLFNGAQLPQERYSGMSTHIYNFNDTSEKELYYQSLDWYQTVFK